jgi:hypothetical protein
MGFEQDCQSVRPSVQIVKLCTRTDWHHHYIIFFHIRWVLFPAEVSSGSQSIWQAKGQKQEREIENSSSCRKSFVHSRNTKNPRPHGVSRPDVCTGWASLAHSPTGRSWGGGVRPKAVIDWSAKIFTTLPEWGYDEIAETDFACQSFQSLFFSWGLWAPSLWWQFFFFSRHAQTHTLESQTPCLCVCVECISRKILNQNNENFAENTVLKIIYLRI